jgi:hypothetical protein
VTLVPGTEMGPRNVEPDPFLRSRARRWTTRDAVIRESGTRPFVSREERARVCRFPESLAGQDRPAKLGALVGAPSPPIRVVGDRSLSGVSPMRMVEFRRGQGCPCPVY